MGLSHLLMCIHYTRTPITCNHSCIDHIFVKYSNYDKNRIEAGVIQTSISDHYSIVLAIELDNILLNNNCVYKMVNYEKLNGILTKEIWTGIHGVDVNECYNSYIDKIISAINKSSTVA